jgi:hypothetical protein
MSGSLGIQSVSPTAWLGSLVTVSIGGSSNIVHWCCPCFGQHPVAGCYSLDLGGEFAGAMQELSENWDCHPRGFGCPNKVGRLDFVFGQRPVAGG